MNNTNIFKKHGKTVIILALCLCMPFVAIWYIASYVNEDIFYEQKKENLFSMARVLESHLTPGGYDEILRDAGKTDATREEQIEALN
ncbi:MAG: hypothetical protein FWF03_05990, partial [Defluviitaleaceae bacterium]|nr:hypothetical protein [Defluviitaleaceae bacterium]